MTSDNGKENTGPEISKDIHIQKAQEEVANRNIDACIAHANETRKLYRELEQKFIFLNNQWENHKNLMDNDKKLVVQLLQAKAAGGTESGDHD